MRVLLRLGQTLATLDALEEALRATIYNQLAPPMKLIEHSEEEA